MESSLLPWMGKAKKILDQYICDQLQENGIELTIVQWVLLKKLKEVDNDGYDLKINWVYEEGDDDIMERGEYYASILDLDINFIESE